MKIALIGYGKMGKAIEAIALQKGHEVVLKIHSQNLSEFTKDNLAKADVAIEFTNPHVAVENIKFCLTAGVAVVSGSTGWHQHKQEVESFCKKNHGCFLYASNFSIGVNIFFEINKQLARLMKSHKEYIPAITEIHHTQKKDAPSGTAITLASQIIHQSEVLTHWVNKEAINEDELSIVSIRQDPAPGTHIIKYHSEVDDIEIIHTAHNRTGFAAGAVVAAEFIQGKKGIFEMKDVLKF